MIVFIIGPQFRLTGLSAIGISTELCMTMSQSATTRDARTYSNQFFTSSSCDEGMEFICNGDRVKSVKTRTISNCFRPHCTRSREAISISLRVTTRNGGSERCTRHSVVGCSLTFVRKGTPSNASSRKGMSASKGSPVYSYQSAKKGTGY